MRVQKRQEGFIQKVSLAIELNTNSVKIEGAEATGGTKVMISCWLSLILPRCLCHHGREMGGLELLVQIYASEGGLAGHIIGGER